MVNIGIPTNEFNEKKFKKFCKKARVQFPQDYIEFLKKNNDGELDENILELPDNECCIRYFYGTTEEDYSDLLSNYKWYADRLPKKCIPIADPDFGNQICMSLDEEHYGKIYFWDHETMDTDYGEKCVLKLEDMVLLADSFESFLDKIH